jgi:hypothetical protein
MKEDVMHGYVAQRCSRFYAAIYEGPDPVIGKEVRWWHPAGTDRAEAARPAAMLAATYGALLHPSDRRGLAPKSVHSLQLIIRGSRDDAVRRGLVSRNVAALGPGHPSSDHCTGSKAQR